LGSPGLSNNPDYEVEGSPKRQKTWNTNNGKFSDIGSADENK
jgi:hypothetical protein